MLAQAHQEKGLIDDGSTIVGASKRLKFPKMYLWCTVFGLAAVDSGHHGSLFTAQGQPNKNFRNPTHKLHRVAHSCGFVTTL